MSLGKRALQYTEALSLWDFHTKVTEICVTFFVVVAEVEARSWGVVLCCSCWPKACVPLVGCSRISSGPHLVALADVHLRTPWTGRA